MTNAEQVCVELRHINMHTPYEEIYGKASALNPFPNKGRFQYHPGEYYPHLGVVRYPDDSKFKVGIPLRSATEQIIEVMPAQGSYPEVNPGTWLDINQFLPLLSQLLLEQEVTLTSRGSNAIGEDSWRKAKPVEVDYQEGWKDLVDPEHVFWTMMNTSFQYAQSSRWRDAIVEIPFIAEGTADLSIVNRTTRCRSLLTVTDNLDFVALGFHAPKDDRYDIKHALRNIMNETISLAALEQASETTFSGSRVAQAHLRNEMFRHGCEKVDAMRLLQSHRGENNLKMSSYWDVATKNWQSLLTPDFYKQLVTKPELD